MSVRLTMDGSNYDGATKITVGGKEIAIAETGVINTPTATKDITANGSNIDVLNYSKVNVNVPSTGITPTGIKSITENGTYDVTNYASAVVNVPTSSGSTEDDSLEIEYELAEDFTATTSSQIATLSSDAITNFLNNYIGVPANNPTVKTVFHESMIYEGDGNGNDVYFVASSIGPTFGRAGSASVVATRGQFSALKNDMNTCANSSDFTMFLLPTYDNKLLLTCRCNSGTTAVFPKGKYKFKITPVYKMEG